MPKKKVEEPMNEAPKIDNKKDDDSEEEDSAAVKEIKAIDEKYCAIEMEFELEAQKLRHRFKMDNANLLEERATLLSATTNSPVEDHAFATPACRGFWLKAFQNCEWSVQCIHDHDEPVLEYLENIKSCDLDEVYEKKGTKFEFFFKQNPFFTNKVLTITVLYDFDPECFKPWMQLDCREVQSSVIDWKAGQNVTVEVTQKKVKGGGAKKAKQKGKQAKEEPRVSFFRFPFCNAKVDGPVPGELCGLYMPPAEEIESPEDSKEAIKEMLVQLSELMEDIDERVVKYAVRLYTGEAGDDESDDFSEDGEEESGDDDDDDSEDEDEPPARGRAKGKPKKAAEPKSGNAEGKKDEECKQQ